MMDKHTPGPWTYKIWDGEGLVIKSGDVFVIDGCGCCGSPWGTEDDAKLIAASPDLLNALRAMVDSYQYEASSKNPALVQARAAIEKATGEKDYGTTA